MVSGPIDRLLALCSSGLAESCQSTPSMLCRRRRSSSMYAEGQHLEHERLARCTLKRRGMGRRRLVSTALGRLLLPRGLACIHLSKETKRYIQAAYLCWVVSQYFRFGITFRMYPRDA